jgi:catechol 2,3-dioxygenase-like lactoylglutathione lyase family enzyme
MSRVDVVRHGHINHAMPLYDKARQFYVDDLGADVFSEWEIAAQGTRNALLLVADACIELFAPTGELGGMAAWVARYGGGWHSLEWTVSDLPAAVAAVEQRGIRLTDVTPAYVFTHPKDCHGLCLELTPARFPGDERDEPEWGARRAEDPVPVGALGIVGLDCIRVSAPDAEAAASWLTELTGQPVASERRLDHLDARAVRVDFHDHAIEFAEPDGDGPMAEFVASNGARIHAVCFRAAGVGGDDVVVLDPIRTQGARIELIGAG